MTQERTPFMTKVIVFVVVFSAIIWAYMRHEQISPRDEAIQELHLPSVPTFHGYRCQDLNCSGHEAGYAWAREHDIQDEGDCESAGRHDNSTSFTEGCYAYISEYDAGIDDDASD